MRALGLCFFLSGFGSLVLEVVWTRQLRLVFGSTTLAASTILVAYMLGLGLGGLAGGRLGSRLRDGIRAYGWMEVAIGLYALAVPWLLAGFPAVNRAWLYTLPFWPAALCRFALSLVVLILPTVLMGATLPVLVTALERRRGAGDGLVGLFYGLNTLGAVTGVFAATFILFPSVGLSGTNAIGAALDLTVGLVTLLVIARRGLARTTPAPAAAVAERAIGRWSLPVLAYAVVGFTALVYEVAWTRALSMVLGSSLYAFSCMLGAFLTGIALGSLAARRMIDRLARPLLAYTSGIAALGVLALGTTLLLPRLPDAFVDLVYWFGSGRVILVQVVLGMLAMLPPTLVLGALFPLLVRTLAGAAGTAGAAVGDVYFANTLGSAAGAFAAGFLLIPTWGLRDTLALASALNLVTAGLLLLWAGGSVARRGAGVVALAAAACLLVLPLPWNAEQLTRGVFRAPLDKADAGVDVVPLEGVPTNELAYYRDGLNTTVSIHRDADIVFLKVNGKTDASSPGDMGTQVLSGEIPLLFGAPASRVLVIGFASGITVGSAARHPVERIDTVEIEPAIFEASHYFDEWNGRPLEDPRVHAIVDDGRTYLSGTRERYDVIISEPSNPWISGVSNLFTREFFRLARGVLRPGGRLLQWAQLYGLDPTGIRAIVAAIRSEFPYVYVFSMKPDYGDLLFLATLEPLRREDLPRWEALPQAVREDLHRIDSFSTEDVWSLVRLLPEDVDRLVRDAPVVNSDENLFVELVGPRRLHQERETLGENWALVRPFARGVLPLLEAVGEPLDAERVGALAFSYARMRQDPDVAPVLARLATARGPSGHAFAVTSQAVGPKAAGRPRAFVLSQLDQAVTLAPEAPDLRLARGALRLEAEAAAAALTDADVALAGRPDDPRARVLRWQSLQALGRLEEAEAELDVLAASPYFRLQPRLWRRAADLYLARGRKDQAAEALAFVLTEDRYWVGGWERLAALEEERGHGAEAARARRNAAQAGHNLVLAMHREARRAAWRGERARAVDLLERAEQQEPGYEPARRDLERLRSGRPVG